MAYNEIRKAIENYLTANWEQTTIAWSNSSLEVNTREPWIRPNLIWSDGQRVLLTGDRNNGEEQRGILSVQIFVPRGTGCGLAYRLGDQLRMLFKEQRLAIEPGDSIVFLVASIEDVGETSEERWYQVNVQVPFRRLD